MRTDAVTDFGQFAELRAGARQDDPATLRKAAQQFESLMTRELLKSMRAASLGDDLLGGSQSEFYRDIADQQLAAHLSSGKGLGIADLLVRQLQGPAAATPGIPTGAALTAEPESFPLPLRLSTSLSSTPAAVPSTAPLRAYAGLQPNPPAPPADDPRECPEGAEAVLARPCTPQEFVQAIQPHAEAAARELGIPSRVLIAQAALETGWGKHQMRGADGKPTFNFFGIKADRAWNGDEVRRGTHEYENGRLQRTRADFRAYDSVGEAFGDYVGFLRSNPRYAQALRHGGDERHFAAGLQKAGYATDPAYAQKILRIARGPTLTAALDRPGPRQLSV